MPKLVELEPNLFVGELDVGRDVGAGFRQAQGLLASASDLDVGVGNFKCVNIR